MHPIDWTVLIGTLLAIVGYGIFRTRNQSGYLRGSRTPGWAIGLSIMATQASAITFLSTPGQAYADGMRFVQFYLGMPIAMVLLCVFVLPVYHRLRVYTAYEFLESRFDRRTRTLTAGLFLVQRGLAAGLTIYAPAIILSSILGWSLHSTTIVIGLLVIAYVYSGGTDAVTQTQKLQMAIIFIGMLVAFYLLLNGMPEGIGFSDTLDLAGVTGRLNVIDLSWDLSDRYTLWTGLLASVFLFLSYFGTDQSQVQRYISGQSLRESRTGLLFNGLLKVPMQFFILLVGVMVFVFYQFHATPIHFNQANLSAAHNSAYAPEMQDLETQLSEIQTIKSSLLKEYIASDGAPHVGHEIRRAVDQEQQLRSRASAVISRVDARLDTEDTDYVFIHFILNHLPLGVIGLLMAVIFSAAMSSTASEINALATTSTVDLYRSYIAPEASEAQLVRAGKGFTLLWGAVAIAFAMTASLFDNLIEAVNIIGSVFYGTILGIFIVALFLKQVGARAVFIAAIIAECTILFLYAASRYHWDLPLIGSIDIAYLWLNMIGCILVICLACLAAMLDRDMQ